jgi:hypothetical protein
MASLRDYDDLLTANVTIDYSKLDASFWDGFSEIVTKNAIDFERQRKSITPTWEDMNRRFDL